MIQGHSRCTISFSQESHRALISFTLYYHSWKKDKTLWDQDSNQNDFAEKNGYKIGDRIELNSRFWMKLIYYNFIHFHKLLHFCMKSHRFWRGQNLSFPTFPHVSCLSEYGFKLQITFTGEIIEAQLIKIKIKQEKFSLESDSFLYWPSRDSGEII